MIVTDTSYIITYKIYDKSFYNPIGKIYFYDEVTVIDTGFYSYRGICNYIIK